MSEKVGTGIGEIEGMDCSLIIQMVKWCETGMLACSCAH